MLSQRRGTTQRGTQTGFAFLEETVVFARRRSSAGVSVGSVLLVIWLVIGVIAAGQRHYFSGTAKSCSKASTIAVTILAGPLNYVGVNPKVNCTVPQPSK